MYIGKSELMEDVEANRSVVKIVRERDVKRYVYSLGVLNTLSVRVSQLVSIDEKTGVREAMEMKRWNRMEEDEAAEGGSKQRSSQKIIATTREGDTRAS